MLRTRWLLPDMPGAQPARVDADECRKPGKKGKKQSTVDVDLNGYVIVDSIPTKDKAARLLSIVTAGYTFEIELRDKLKLEVVAKGSGSQSDLKWVDTLYEAVNRQAHHWICTIRRAKIE